MRERESKKAFSDGDFLKDNLFLRTLDKLLAIMDNVSHPLHTTIVGQRSLFSGRLLSYGCSTDRLRRSFVPRATRLFNTLQGRRRAVEPVERLD